MRGGLSEWEQKLQPVLEEEGAELLEAHVSRRRNSYQFRFFVDREAGIGVNELAHLSRKIGIVLDADPLLVGNYSLEVSSPGMNRVVRTEAHFRRFVGERVHVWTRESREGRNHFEGTIRGCQDGVVTVAVDRLGETEFDLRGIERAELRLDPKRRPAGAGRRGEKPDGERASGQ
jgi:ribosome maturation factor RimP